MKFREFLQLDEALSSDIVVGVLTIPKGEIEIEPVNSKCVLKWKVMGSRAWLGRWELRNRFVELWGKRISKEGYLVITSQSERDQLQNIYNCVAKLRQLVEAALMKTQERVPTKPTEGSQKKRLEDKERRQRLKQQRNRIFGVE